MSKKPFTPATPRYRIQSEKGDFLDVYNKRANAIKACTKMAIEYPGACFYVVKRVNFKDEVIFSMKWARDVEFEDIKPMYEALVDTLQKELDKTRYWRKPDVV